jgi:hypothetical protein
MTQRKVYNITQHELIDAYASLSVLASKQLPGPIALRCAQNLRLLQPLKEAYDDTARLLQSQAASRDQNGEIIKTRHGISIKDPEAYRNQIDELRKEMVSVELYDIDITAIVDKAESIEPAALAGLLFMFDGES